MLLQHSEASNFTTDCLEEAVAVFKKEEQYLEEHFEKVTTYSNFGEQNYVSCTIDEIKFDEDGYVEDIVSIKVTDYFHWKD